MLAENKLCSSLYELSAEDDSLILFPFNGYFPEEKLKEMRVSSNSSIEELKKS
jgi:hypothetical protein